MPVLSNPPAALRARPRAASSAFTLTELLVVLAIVGLLAAVLLPIFAHAREKARQAICLANEKQIGLGILSYCQDYDDTLPLGSQYGDGCSDHGFTVVLSAYIQKTTPFATGGVRGANVWACPDDVVPRVNLAPFAALALATDAVSVTYPVQSYTYPAGFVAPNSPYPRYGRLAWNRSVQRGACANVDVGAPLADLLLPSGTIILVEENNPQIWLSGNAGGVTAPAFDPGHGSSNWGTTQDCADPTGNRDTTPCARRLAAPPHHGGWNYLYGDGHARWKRPEDTVGKPSATSPSQTQEGVRGPDIPCAVLYRPCGDWTLDDKD